MRAMTERILVVGGGIAGLSCAAFLAPHAQVTLVEAEPILTYHTTGRSAALYTECFGDDALFRVAAASRSFLVDRAEPFGKVRPLLFVGPPEDAVALDDLEALYRSKVPGLERIDAEAVNALFPVVPPQRAAGGLVEPGAMDLDVHALVTEYAGLIRRSGGSIRMRARFAGVRKLDSGWEAQIDDEALEVDLVVNASGAWGNEVARGAGIDALPLEPLKRSAFTFDPGGDAHGWPFVIDVLERWYVKPEGAFALGSAASEIPSTPHDARPDEIDVALGIERITNATTLEIRSVKTQWAGLRTFTPDRRPAIGFEPGSDSFFWLVGQGGAGVLTSPAVGALAASLARGARLPEFLADAGVEPLAFDPARFRTPGTATSHPPAQPAIHRP